MVISKPQKENKKGIKAAQVEGPWQESEESAALGARKEQLVKPFRSGNQRASVRRFPLPQLLESLVPEQPQSLRDFAWHLLSPF